MAIKISENRRAGMAVVGLAIKSTASQDPTAAATDERGTGAPTHTANNGSVYVRTDATTADNALYIRINDAWVAMKGAT